MKIMYKAGQKIIWSSNNHLSEFFTINYIFSHGFLQNLALIFSGIFSPYVLNIVLPFLVIHQFSGYSTGSLVYLEVWLLFGVMLPGIFIIRTQGGSFLSDFHISKKEKRIFPLIMMAVCIAIMVLTYEYLNAPKLIFAAAFAYLMNVIIVLIVTIFWKISVHASALAGFITLFAVTLNQHYFLWLILAAAVVWSRVIRHRHTILQGLAGTIAGFAMTYLSILMIR